MKSFVALIIASSILVSALSIGGMAGGFGHSMGGAMDEACSQASCPSASDSMGVVDCVEHCLAAFTSVSPSAPFVVLTALFAAVLLLSSTGRRGDAGLDLVAALEGFIGKLLLRQRLSTIVLRN